jgi:cell cycle sensor histidine kinase DivJ
MGADRAGVAAAAALAMAPAFATFLILPRLGDLWGDVGILAVWLLSAMGLVAETGGVSSPLAVMFVVAPALALALGRRWGPEVGGVAVLGYAGASALALFSGAGELDLGPFPEAIGAASIAFAAGLMTLGQAAPSALRERAVGQRIAEVSHELRTPLTHILGFSEMIERKIFGDINDRYVEYASLIRNSGSHLLGLVNDLLDLSSLEAGRYDLAFDVFDVRSVVEDVVRLSANAANKKAIALGMVTPPSPLLVRADARAVKRMLINTLGNAIKFTPEGGRVIVTAGVREGVLTLDTTDNGPGIPEAERARLGFAYERGSGVGQAEGAGLGLSLVRALADLHGGALSLHEAPGGGALVRITLPVLIAD